ncbi:MAG: GWxTD domain-containing protein [Bacteroidetes bacterium]|nr:GWxTD domain-containing protein [Bacteroidota bacterium]
MKTLILSFLLLSSFTIHAQDPLIIPSHQFVELRGDSADVVSTDLIYFPVKQIVNLQYQWGVVLGGGPEEPLVSTALQFNPGEDWIEVSNKKTIKVFNQGNQSTSGEFKRLLTYNDQTIQSGQSFKAVQSDLGTVIYSTVAAIKDTRGGIIRVHKPLFETASDSILLTIQLFLPKKFIGTKLTLGWSLDLSEEATLSKRSQFTPSSTSPGFDVPIGRLPGTFKNGGRATISFDIYNEKREVLFSGVSSDIFIKGTVSAEPTLRNTEDPFYLTTYSTTELSELLEVSSLFETADERRIRKGLINRTDQLAFLNRFWTIREQKEDQWLPTFHELRDRISIARTSKFEYLGTPFYQTDRGRILLIYGIPDQIEKVPFEYKTVDIELWQYHSIENGVEFIFIDINRNKEFRLVHSTKNGEVYNPDYDEDFKREKQRVN